MRQRLTHDVETAGPADQYLPPDPHAARTTAAATTPKTGAVLRDQGVPVSRFK